MTESTGEAMTRTPQGMSTATNVAIGVGVIGIALGAWWFLRPASLANEEPPIRVKNGSVTFGLEPEAGKAATWIPAGKDQNWTPSAGEILDDFQVVVLKADNYAGCSANDKFSGTVIVVGYDDGTGTIRRFVLHSAGKAKAKTWLTPKKELTADPQGLVVTHGLSKQGFISEFTVLGQNGGTCSAKSADPKPALDVRICSWDSAKPCPTTQ